jgi:hypothetical protein
MRRRDYFTLVMSGAAFMALATLSFQALHAQAPQTAQAIIGTTTPRVVYSPVTTSSTSSTPAPTTAHEALQADLNDPNSFVVAELDPELPCREWAPLALKVGWPAEQLPTLLRVIWKESRCLAGVVNQQNHADHGLTQVNQIHRAYVESLFGEPFEVAMADPEKNLTFALRLWSDREAQGLCGWQPWSIACA